MSQCFASVQENMFLDAIRGLVMKGNPTGEEQSEAFNLALDNSSDIPMAHALLGLFYEFGVGTLADCREAEKCYRRALEMQPENCLAFIRLYDLLYFGAPNVLMNPEEAENMKQRLADMVGPDSLSWPLSSGESKWPLGLFLQARCYEEGLVYSKDHLMAFQLYQKAAQMQFPYAQAAVAVCLHFATGTRQSPQMSMEWANRALKQSKDARILLALGRCHSAADDAKAAHFYKQSACLGHPVACFLLASLLEAGGNGLPKDWAEAYRWFTKALDMGHREAIYMIGRMHEMGEVDQSTAVPLPDYMEALQWFRRGMNRRDNSSRQKVEYYSRLSGNQTYVELLTDIVSKAAFENDARSQLALAKFYLKGLAGQRVNSALAVHWLRQAHLGNQPRATMSLAVMYEDGFKGIVEKDPERAFELAKKAVDSAHLDNDWDQNIFDERPGCSYGDGFYQLPKDAFWKAAKDLLAIRHYLRNNFEEAIQLWTELHENGHWNAARHLGWTYQKMAKKTKVKKEKRVLEDLGIKWLTENANRHKRRSLAEEIAGIYYERGDQENEQYWLDRAEEWFYSDTD